MNEVRIISLRDRLIFEFLENRRSTNTRESYRQDLNCFFNFISLAFPKIDHPQLIEGIHCTAYRKYLREVKRYSPNTMQRRLAGISKFFEFLQVKNICYRNPLDLIEREKSVNVRDTEALDDNEVQEVIELITPDLYTNVYALPVLILIATGIRRAEVLNIKKRDFFKRRAGTFLSIVGKGGKRVEKLIPDWVASTIETYCDIHDIGDNDFICSFLKKGKRAMGYPVGLNRFIKKIILTCGIQKRISTHSFRATYITNALFHKYDLHKIQSDVGHSDVKTTLRYNKKNKSLEDSPTSVLPYLKQATR